MLRKAERAVYWRADLLLAVLALTVLASGSMVSGQTAKPASTWDLGALAQPPTWESLERPASASAKPIFFKGPPLRGKPTRVFAWLGLPDAKPGEKVPGMVLVHGGGGTAFDEWVRLWVKRGYAVIAVDTCGQVPVGKYGAWVHDPEGGPPGWGGFGQIDEPRQDQWVYHAIAKVVLAHSLLRSLKVVDAERTGVTGISWGGYLTCIAAGIDSRFKLAVPVYGCGFYQQTAFKNPLSQMSPEGASRWLSWWDASVYLGDSKCPMLWVTGSNDFAYPLDAFQRSYRLPGGPRTLCVRLRMPHGHGGAGENPEEIRVFADSILKGDAPLPRILDHGRQGVEVWATFEAKRPVAKAELNWTRGSGAWEQRRWDTIEARLAEGRVTASLPAEARVYYFNLFDDRGCVVSTEHVELPAR
jgi:dienelactone hydrolase